MARLATKAVANARVEENGNGMALHLKSSAVKAWVFRYPHPATGKQDKVTFATYRDKSLKEAREYYPGMR